MIRIINNTDLAVGRLMALYGPEIKSVDVDQIESIVFDASRMIIYGVDTILLEVDESVIQDIFEKTILVGF